MHANGVALLGEGLSVSGRNGLEGERDVRCLLDTIENVRTYLNFDAHSGKCCMERSVKGGSGRLESGGLTQEGTGKHHSD